MQDVVDEKAWFEAYLDTPLCPPRHASSAEDAMKTPGCRLKSKARRNPFGFPDRFGILVSFDLAADQAVVRGYGDCVSPKFVWTGTVREYLAAWICD